MWNIVCYLILLLGISKTYAVVTNEDIRIAILQITNVVRAIDDKLERHEYRDRAVSEQIKKGMLNIDKRIKMLDPLKGTVGRLDERLAAVETILMQKGEKEKMQLQRTYEAVIDIQKNLPVIMEEMKNEIISKICTQEPPAQMTEPTVTKKEFEKMEKEVLNKIDQMAVSVGKIQGELSKIDNGTKVAKDLHSKTTDNLEKLKRHISDSEQVLTKYDKKVADYNNKIPNIPVPNYKEQEELKKNILKALDTQKTSVKDIQQDIKNLQNQVKQLPQKSDINNFERTTLNKLSNITISRDAALDNISQNLNNIVVKINNSHEDEMKNINGVTATLMKSFANANAALDNQKVSLKDIQKDIKSLQTQVKQLPQKDDISNIQRTALNKLSNITNSQDAALDTLRQNLNNIIGKIKETHDEEMQNINGVSEITATLMKSFANTNADINSQKSSLKDILQDLKILQNRITQMPQKDDINSIEQLLNQIETILTSNRQDPSIEAIQQTLNTIKIMLNETRDDTIKNIGGLTDITGTLMKSITNTNSAIDAQKLDITKILSNTEGLRQNINQLPHRTDLDAAQQAAFKKFEEVCESNKNNPISDKINKKLDDININLNMNYASNKKSLDNLTDVTENLMKNVATNYAFNGQKSDVKEILLNVRNLQNQINHLPQKYDLDKEQNNTLQELQKISIELSNCKEDSTADIQNILETINKSVNKSHEDIAEKLNDLSDITANLGGSFSTNYDKIKAELHEMNKLDQVMIKTADSVIDTKRRLEFGVHQILAEITKQSKDTAKHVQQAVSDRLDIFEQTFLDEDTGALANVTAKIDEDIQQVWRQIGIMYQELNSNSEILKQLQNETDAYVTGSLGAMDSMKGKVTQITGRITEVDENLNYLLGRLSLVTQEFNQIKTGLSTAMDKIKESFQAVQDKMNQGPGPHKFSEGEVPIA